VVKCGALEILVLRANLLVASNKANLKQGNDGLTTTQEYISSNSELNFRVERCLVSLEHCRFSTKQV